MGFPRQEYWSGLPLLPPGDLPDPGIEPASPALQADSLPLSHLGNHKAMQLSQKKNKIMPFAATWMPLEIITLSEVKSEKDKYHMISLICGI